LKKISKRVIEITKRKSTAIILAVFFSCFAWIYTWKFDRDKFWGGFLANVLLWWTIIVPIIVWIWAIVDMASKKDDMFTNYSKWKIKK
jgi:hypothetical protein